ncbi:MULTISPECIES: hypothetical protein [unclassified Kitasatospora]
MTPREATPALLRAVRHPVTRCLLACLATAVAVAAAAGPTRSAAGPGCPGRR